MNEQLGLTRETLKENPYHQFDGWLQEAQTAKVPLAYAMNLATASATGQVSSRVVMLRYFDENGFVFFSSYNTLTAAQIDENPQVSLLFPWLVLQRQVKVMGTAVKVPVTESLRFFNGRHAQSQLGIWLSPQSDVISSKNVLKAKLAEIKQKFRDGQLPMPSFWGGYRVVPRSIEFWQGQSDGLHDRFVYSRQDDTQWTIERLMP